MTADARSPGAGTALDSISIDCALRSPEWAASLPESEALARRAARAALAAAATAPFDGGELSLALSDDAELQILNKAYRGKDGPTNVLSFPGEAPDAADQPRQLGDVVLAYGVCLREAQAQDKSLADHLAHLVVHGVLHLLGHDHETEAEAERMEALEVRILAGLGIADPYLAAADERKEAAGA